MSARGEHPAGWVHRQRAARAVLEQVWPLDELEREARMVSAAARIRPAWEQVQRERGRAA